MTSRGYFISKSRDSFAAAIVLIGSLGVQQVYAQLGVGDIVLGRSEASDTFRVYDASAGTWSPGPGWQVDGTDAAFIQGIEFDNSNGYSRNARGNLLGTNFGNAFTGFEIFNFATDGATNGESVFSIVQATGGTRGTDPMGAWLSQRGGGVSVSPDNNLLAWTNYDTGEIYVHDYSAGATPGTGSGVSVSGARKTGLGDGNGNAGSFMALADNPRSTQGSAWINDTTLVALNGYGELIKLDINGISGGTEDGTLAGWQPTVMTNWTVEDTAIFPANAQQTDIDYNPLLDPNHIYAAVTTTGSFETLLLAYDYNPGTGAISLNRMLQFANPTPETTREPREIALDADGNLWYSGYAGSTSDNIIMKLPNATNIAGWDAANVEVFYNSPDYTSFNGMDVAFSEPPVTGLLGDYNGNDVLDAADYTVWRNAIAVGGTIPNDPTGGVATQDDYDYWKANFGAVLGGGSFSSTTVPEPGTLAMLLFVSLAGAVRRKRSCFAAE